MDTSALKNSVLSFMKSFNFITVLYISVISAVTIIKIGNSGGAVLFLKKVKRKISTLMTRVLIFY